MSEVGEIMLCEYLDPEFSVCKLKKCEVNQYVCDECDLQDSEFDTTGKGDGDGRRI